MSDSLEDSEDCMESTECAVSSAAARSHFVYVFRTETEAQQIVDNTQLRPLSPLSQLDALDQSSIESASNIETHCSKDSSLHSQDNCASDCSVGDKGDFVNDLLPSDSVASTYRASGSWDSSAGKRSDSSDESTIVNTSTTSAKAELSTHSSEHNKRINHPRISPHKRPRTSPPHSTDDVCTMDHTNTANSNRIPHHVLLQGTTCTGNTNNTHSTPVITAQVVNTHTTNTTYTTTYQTNTRHSKNHNTTVAMEPSSSPPLLLLPLLPPPLLRPLPPVPVGNMEGVDEMQRACIEYASKRIHKFNNTKCNVDTVRAYLQNTTKTHNTMYGTISKELNKQKLYCTTTNSGTTSNSTTTSTTRTHITNSVNIVRRWWNNLCSQNPDSTVYVPCGLNVVTNMRTVSLFAANIVLPTEQYETWKLRKYYSDRENYLSMLWWNRHLSNNIRSVYAAHCLHYCLTTDSIDTGVDDDTTVESVVCDILCAVLIQTTVNTTSSIIKDKYIRDSDGSNTNPTTAPTTTYTDNHGTHTMHISTFDPHTRQYITGKNTLCKDNNFNEIFGDDNGVVYSFQYTKRGHVRSITRCVRVATSGNTTTSTPPITLPITLPIQPYGSSTTNTNTNTNASTNTNVQVIDLTNSDTDTHNSVGSSTNITRRKRTKYSPGNN